MPLPIIQGVFGITRQIFCTCSFSFKVEIVIPAMIEMTLAEICPTSAAAIPSKLCGLTAKRRYSTLFASNRLSFVTDTPSVAA